MATVIRTEKRKRGIVGKILLGLFWIFNIFMAASLFMGLSNTGDLMQTAATKSQSDAMAVGAAIGSGLLITFWMAGAVILGLLVLFTPGKIVITETTKD